LYETERKEGTRRWGDAVKRGRRDRETKNQMGRWGDRGIGRKGKIKKKSWGDKEIE
jgi:hypothetical protein